MEVLSQGRRDVSLQLQGLVTHQADHIVLLGFSNTSVIFLLVFKSVMSFCSGGHFHHLQLADFVTFRLVLIKDSPFDFFFIAGLHHNVVR